MCGPDQWDTYFIFVLHGVDDVHVLRSMYAHDDLRPKVMATRGAGGFWQGLQS